MKKICLLGSGGMVGTTLRREFAREPSFSLNPLYARTIIDVCGPGDPRDFKSLSGVGRALFSWSRLLELALDEAEASPRVIHLSTMDLNFPPDVPQLYLVYKTLQRDFLRVLIETRGISVQIIETSCIFGLDISETRFISKAVKAAKTSSPIKVSCKDGSPSNRPWTSVTHLAQVIINLASREEKEIEGEEILTYFSFMATAKWVAENVISLLNSNSQIVLDDFYNRPESASHIFSVWPTGYPVISPLPEDEATHELHSTIRFLAGDLP